MSVPLTNDVLQDEIAITLARALAVANKQAKESGIDVQQSIITISQNFSDGFSWQINYGPKDYIGRRGGDLIIEVDAADGTIKQVLHGQ